MLKARGSIIFLLDPQGSESVQALAVKVITCGSGCPGDENRNSVLRNLDAPDGSRIGPGSLNPLTAP